MKSPIDKLYKFLKLEVDRGYDDRAVFGGLKSILQSWENEARAAEVPNIIIQAVTARLRDYHQLTPASREEILSGLWRRIQRSSPEPVPDLFSKPSRGKDREKKTSKRKSVEAWRPESEESDSMEQVVTVDEPTSTGSGPPEMIDAKTTVSEPDERELEERTSDEIDDDDDEFADGETVEEELEEALSVPEGARRYKVSPVLSDEEAAALSAPLTVISGIGPKIADRLAELSIRTLGDALYYFPRRYDDYSRLEPINRLMYGQTVTVIGSVETVNVRPIKSGRKLIEALISDGSGAIRATWFNQPWLVDQLQKAGNVSLSGKIDQYLGRLVMNNPEWEALENRHLHTRRIVPVYALTGKISQKWLRGKIKEIVDYWSTRVRDPYPSAMIDAGNLMPLSIALKQVHYPDTWESLEEARHRLAFDEIFSIQISLMRQRRVWAERTGTVIETSDGWLQSRFNRLPYSLTGAQRTAIDDLRRDLASGRPMNRLLQGDVGSGKTVVAAMAIGMVASTGAQTAIMAPTSILAEQHYLGLSELLTGEDGLLLPEEIALVIGATPDSEKLRIKEMITAGTVKLVIGTHALLEPDVIFDNLNLVIIDEQHRFGVNQRATLRDKGENPHLLVMTATPIPRSLALTVYGDLDISVMDEMPPGREEISTYLLRPIERERAYTLIKREVDKGGQAFIIYPLVEETEKSEAKAAVDEYDRLKQDVFHDYELGLLHGRLSSDEKEAAMARFRAGEVQVMVSTSVVEVGVDVPNATVMVIEGANRFGLAQLHQFRGRVGRGADKSFCLLIPDQDDALENERLHAMVETNDGFILAEKDLEQRGPGEFLGTRQSGYSKLQLANITDVKLIEKSRRIAENIIEIDPDLSSPDHRLIREQIDRMWIDQEGDVS